MADISNSFYQIFLYFYSKSGYIFYLLDLLNQKIIEGLEDDEEEEEDLLNLYDIDNDIIKVEYIIEKKHKYIFCIDRKNDINIKEIYEKLMKKTYEEYFMYVELNGHDITERLNKYVGPNGVHLNYNNLKIKWLLTNNEIENFKKLIIMDQNGNEIIYKTYEDFLKIN